VNSHIGTKANEVKKVPHPPQKRNLVCEGGHYYASWVNLPWILQKECSKLRCKDLHVASTMKKTASQCLLWGIHVNSCIGTFARDVALPHLQNLLAYSLQLLSVIQIFEFLVLST